MMHPTLSERLADPGSNHIALQRVLLSLAVVVSHSYDLGPIGIDPWEGFSADTVSLGGMAVHGFFVLSGYLMAQSWSQVPSVPGYLTRRVLRIVPGYLWCLCLGAIVFGPALEWLAKGSLIGYDWMSAWGYVWRNGLLMVHQMAIGNTSAHQPFGTLLNAPLWSLSWEFLCYLGILGLGLIGGIKRRSWLVVLAFLVFYLNLTLDPLHSRFFTRLYSTETTVRLPVFFLAGTMFWAFAGSLRSITWLPILGLITLIMGTRFGAYIWVAPLALPMILFGSAALCAAPAWLLKRDYSYGLYLYGFLIQRLLWEVPAIRDHSWLYCLCATLGALPFAVFSWHFIEQPALGWRKPVMGWISSAFGGSLKS
jgi:peptidoglycan/LPS O-acetylase OafA/YrhL